MCVAFSLTEKLESTIFQSTFTAPRATASLACVAFLVIPAARTKEAINNLGPTDFHWPNYFHRNKKELIPLLNNLLEQKEILNQGVYLSSGFSELVDSLNYPYSIYLKLAGELMMHDIITSQITAKSLLEF